jgi:hypothetical protein
MRIPQGSFKNVSPGSHDARLLRVIDLGTRMEAYENNPPELRHTVQLAFEVLDEYADSGDPLLIMAWFTLSLWKTSNMRKFFDSWIGREMTKEECDRFSFEPFLGKACEIFVVAHNDGVKIQSVVKAKAQKNYPPLVNAPFIFDLDNPDPAIFARIGEKTRTKILESQEAGPIQVKLLAGVDASRLGNHSGAAVAPTDAEEIAFGDPKQPVAAGVPKGAEDIDF